MSSRAVGSIRPTPIRAWSRDRSSPPRRRPWPWAATCRRARRSPRTSPRSARSFEEAGVLLADVGPGSSPGRSARRGPRWSVARSGSRRWPPQLDLTLRTDWLVPLSRWVTPPSMPAPIRCPVLRGRAPRRCQGDAARVTRSSSMPGFDRADALAAMAAGELGALAADEHDPPAARARRGSSTKCGHGWRRGRWARSSSRTRRRDVVRIVMPAGGGVAGQPVNAYLVGRRSFVLVDPGDPTGPGLDRAIAEAGGARWHDPGDRPDPCRSGPCGRRRGARPAAGRRRSWSDRVAGDRCRTRSGSSRDDEVIDVGDVPLRVVATPGPRPDHLAFVVGDGSVVLSGDLDGRRGARIRSPARPMTRRGRPRLPVSVTSLRAPRGSEAIRPPRT